MAKAFASAGDLKRQKVTLEKLGDGLYACTAEGDPNTGVIVGDDCVMVIDAQATPVMAKRIVAKIRTVTKKPIRYVLLTHYHAVRVLGATGFEADEVITSAATRELIAERGAQDFKSEADRFPRLFEAIETVPGLTWPTLTFEHSMTLWFGKREVQIVQIGRGHTKGDTVVWLPKEKVLFAGDLVEKQAALYCGDAYLTEWPSTLDKLRALKPRKLVPGRGSAATTPKQCQDAMDSTERFVKDLMGHARFGVKRGWDLKRTFDRAYADMTRKYGDWPIYEHCIPFNVSRAFDEASGIVDPRIWTAARDKVLWKQLQG